MNRLHASFGRQHCGIKSCFEPVNDGTAEQLRGVHQLRSKYTDQPLNNIPICERHLFNRAYRWCVTTATKSVPLKIICDRTYCGRDGKPFLLNRKNCTTHGGIISGPCIEISPWPKVNPALTVALQSENKLSLCAACFRQRIFRERLFG